MHHAAQNGCFKGSYCWRLSLKVGDLVSFRGSTGVIVRIGDDKWEGLVLWLDEDELPVWEDLELLEVLNESR